MTLRIAHSVVATATACFWTAFAPAPAAANADMKLFAAVSELQSKPDPDAQVARLFETYPDLADRPKSALFTQRTPIDTVLEHCITPIGGVCSPAVIRRLVAAGAQADGLSEMPDGMAAYEMSILAQAMQHHSALNTRTARLNETFYAALARSSQDALDEAGANGVPQASHDDFLVAVKTLLDLGADPNVKGLGDTPLIFWAAEFGPDFVAMFLDAGADPAPAVAKLRTEIATARDSLAAMDAP